MQGSGGGVVLGGSSVMLGINILSVRDTEKQVIMTAGFENYPQL